MSEVCSDCPKKLPDKKRKLDPMWEAQWPCGLYVKPVGCMVYTRPQAEAPEDWKRELKSMLNGMTFPDQIISYVEDLLKAEREKVLGEIEETWGSWQKMRNKIAEIRKGNG